MALLGNTTPDTALSETATLSDSWVFKRIRREYAAADLTRMHVFNDTTQERIS